MPFGAPYRPSKALYMPFGAPCARMALKFATGGTDMEM